MNTAVERLNTAVDNLQADLNPYRGIEAAPDNINAAEEALLIMAAAQFNALRRGADLPDPSFVAQLRARLPGGTDPRSKHSHF